MTILSPECSTYKRIEEMRNQFDEAQTVSQFICVLGQYISWFNYDLAVRIVKVYLSDKKELVKQWANYRERLKEYFASDNSFAVQYGDAIDFGLPRDYLNCRVMIVKVTRDDYSMNDMFFFHEAIPKALFIENYRFHLCRVDRGCLQLTYSVPDFLYSVLFPLSTQQCHSLAEIGIFKVTCGDYAYDMEQVSTKLLIRLCHIILCFCVVTNIPTGGIVPFKYQ